MLARLAKQSSFTKYLNPDSLVPTIEASESAPDELIRKARRSDGSFTWVCPEKRPSHVLRWTSPQALEDLGIPRDEPASALFQEIVAGQTVVVDESKGVYPWAQNYAGYQFGQWAGQLGDGRVTTLFELNQQDLQLKGAGLTPYSRFADGKAVLRSSIREALASETLNALNIPTTRALALTDLPETYARRERRETCAIVARFAPSWVRIGTFNLHHARGDRVELRKLADYCIEQLHLGQESKSNWNRYASLYNDIALRNARMVARCQAYGFLNGVLNTDNVSILGLSMDYGPFAFMDNFSHDFSPNHDDDLLRYGYRSVPSIMWWNLVRLAEALGELIGAQNVDSEKFKVQGTPESERDQLIERLSGVVGEVKSEYDDAYKSEFYTLMAQRLGVEYEPSDTPKLVDSMLQMLESTELDYNQFLRNLSSFEPGEHAKFASDVVPRVSSQAVHGAKSEVESWLASQYAPHVKYSSERKAAMDLLNPHFVLKNWVLNDVIEKASVNGDWSRFDSVAHMALDPFAESWDPKIVPKDIAELYTGLVPRAERGITCSCSS